MYCPVGDQLGGFREWRYRKESGALLRLPP